MDASTAIMVDGENMFGLLFPLASMWLTRSAKT